MAGSQSLVCTVCGGKHHAKGLCRTCYNRQWNAANKERAAVTARRNRSAHPTTVAAAARRYRERFPERLLERSNHWRVDNQDHVHARRRELRALDPELARAKARLYYAENTESQREYRRRYRASHVEQQRAAERRRRAANPVAYAIRKAKRRTSERAGGYMTAAIWAEILEWYGWRCAYCGASDVPLELDHVIPVSRGGETTRENIVPACGTCNKRKGNRLGWSPREVAAA